MKKNKEIENLNLIVTAYKNDDKALFDKNLPKFKENMELKLKKKLTDQECVLLVSSIVNLFASIAAKEKQKDDLELEMD